MRFPQDIQKIRQGFFHALRSGVGFVIQQIQRRRRYFCQICGNFRFTFAVAGKSEVRLAVKRLSANRVVTVKAAVGPRM